MRHSSIGILLIVVACTPRDADDRQGDTGRAGASSAATPTCYRLTQSVMGRETPLRGKASVAPGWIRLGPATGADSGVVLLADADGAILHGVWTRPAAGGVHILAFDDFLRVQIEAVQSADTLGGAGLATSDAELVRDSAGRLRELRRSWTLSGRTAPCDSLPAFAISSAPAA